MCARPDALCRSTQLLSCGGSEALRAAVDEGPSRRQQIAQQLHAVTDPPADGRTNDRFRDLLDIVMLSAVVPASPELHEVCEETFAIRQRHGWPPEIVLYPHWRDPMEQRAREMGLGPQSADDIVAHVVRYIRDIARAI